MKISSKISQPIKQIRRLLQEVMSNLAYAAP